MTGTQADNLPPDLQTTFLESYGEVLLTFAVLVAVAILLYFAFWRTPTDHT